MMHRPPIKSGLNLTFPSGKYTRFSPVFTLRDRNNGNSLVTTLEPWPPESHILDKTVNSVPQRWSTLLFTVIASSLCTYSRVHTYPGT